MAVDTNYRAGIKLLLKSEWSSFFATFARFEYALKRAGYLKYEKPGTAAEAGWDRFAADLEPDFYPQCQGLEELQILFVAPPQLLKVEMNRSVTWKKARAVNSVSDFFQVIRDVRNSLFHGEKHVHSDRDHKLINAAQTTLDLAWHAATQNSENKQLAKFCESFRFKP